MHSSPLSRTAGQTELELLRRQLDAIDAWNQARRSYESSSSAASREQRMDLARRLEVLRSEHAAIVARSHAQLMRSVRLLANEAARRAVVVHRNAWVVDKVCAGLVEHGIEVVERLENGADAVGVIVAEQPDLLLVEDTLPMVGGEEVVRETRRYSPATIIAVHVAYDDRIAPLLEAGATTAFTRRVPPAEVARELSALLVG